MTPTPKIELPAQGFEALPPSEWWHILQTGGCVAGVKLVLDEAAGSEVEPTHEADERCNVINICLSLYEEYGDVCEGGATQEAWEWEVLRRCEQIPEGREIALHALESYREMCRLAEEGVEAEQ